MNINSSKYGLVKVDIEIHEEVIRIMQMEFKGTKLEVVIGSHVWFDNG